MSENDVTSKPNYERRWIVVSGTLLVLLLVLRFGIIQPLFYRPVQVTRGPWQVLDPGKPVEPLKFEVVEEGTGAAVEPGDLVQISLWLWSAKEEKLERQNDDWWVWVGFRTKKETPFHSINTRLISAFIGIREGGGIRFFESPHQSIDAGKVYINPFGSYSLYANSKTGYPNTSRSIYIPTSSGHTVAHIKKVFKGQLKYRTTHLYDDSWFHRCYNWFSCEYTNTPREIWCDEALYEGISADGRQASFKYGPVTTPGKGVTC
ncbi:MAG: hypothetical protein LBI87_12145, partial [Candidatus Accumulibacter sp.]|nr:hypothetical protein [Accumulibacter sp.]